jgi:long-chain acyl-CoA synthetase
MANCWCAAVGLFRLLAKAAANAECFDAEGWFRTGDIAHLDADGFLYITDRKKELLKTSGGKLVAPQPIENKLKNNVLVAQAALVGDKHKFISALISPNFARWKIGRASRH